MKQKIFIIDNDKKHNELLKNMFMNCDECKDITVEAFFYDERLKSCETNIFCKIEGLKISLDEAKNDKNISLCVLVDACLSEEEHEMNDLEPDRELTGMKCADEIERYMKVGECKTQILLATTFFTKQLSNSKRIVLETPIDEMGDIDNGFDVMPNYIDILPTDQLSRKRKESFINVVLYKLKEK